MTSARRLKVALVALLAAAMIWVAMLYPRATRQLVAPDQQPLVDRAVRDAAAALGMTPEEERRITFPLVIELSGQTCVELRTTRPDAAGNYLACYDDRTGKILEERVSLGF